MTEYKLPIYDYQAILEKAIKKAIANGWKPDKPLDGSNIVTDNSPSEVLLYIAPTIIFNHDFAKALWGEPQDAKYFSHVARFMFPGYVDTTNPLHNSADLKLVQNEDMCCFRCGKVFGSMYDAAHTGCDKVDDIVVGWNHHLKNMVIAPDPIKYLADNI